MCRKVYLRFLLTLSLFLYCFSISTCQSQIGPDPWDYEGKTHKNYNQDLPPDLEPVAVKKPVAINQGIGDWFYKRLLAIVLKGGNVQNNEDGSVDISIQMKYSQERWRVMEEYISVNTALNEDMFRRSMGYVEESIYKPTITEKIVMAWSEYVQFYILEYKTHITWLLSLSAVAISTYWLWNHISHKHVIIIIFIGLYLYEGFVSYKEAEKQELETFIKAVNTCKWFMWSSECAVPPPDPLIFLKHMNPLKIAIRMFTTLISEPMLTISATIKIMIHGITDGLWYPLDKIVYGLLVLTFNVLLVFLLILIMFNYILNIPFSLSFLGIGVGFKQRNRSFTNNITEAPRVDNVDRISGETLTRILDVCSRALNTAQTSNVSRIDNKLPVNAICNTPIKLKRSASTGRLPSGSNYNNNFESNTPKFKHNGSGDAR